MPPAAGFVPSFANVQLVPSSPEDRVFGFLMCFYQSPVRRDLQSTPAFHPPAIFEKFTTTLNSKFGYQNILTITHSTQQLAPLLTPFSLFVPFFPLSILLA